MKTNGKHEVIAGTARRSLVLAALLAVALAFAGTSFAQSNSAVAPPPADAKGAHPAQPASSLAAAARAPRGKAEGIQIHGQWTIEVRNRDGSVAKHVEFENALTPDDGPFLLAGLLSGNLTTGAWSIWLAATPSACVNGLGVCTLVPPGASFLLEDLGPCSTSLAQASPQPSCYETLTYSFTGADYDGYSQFTLSGQAYVDTATSIASVQTWQNACGSNSTTATVSSNVTSPSTCFPNPTFYYNGASTGSWFEFTEYDFGQVGSCGGSGQPLCPIPVQVGQIVSATVQFSFSSPSSSSAVSNIARPHRFLTKPLTAKPTGAEPTGIQPQ